MKFKAVWKKEEGKRRATGGKNGGSGGINDAGDVGNGQTEKSWDVHTGLNGKTGSDPLDPVTESDAKVCESTTPDAVEARGRTCVTRPT